MNPLRNNPRPSGLSGQLMRLSDADRGSFSKLTSSADIQNWTRAKMDEYHQFTLALTTIHNLAAPIHCLPTAELERIFAYCWNDRKSLCLSHVCRLWRSIILGKAAFWADAVTNCGPFYDERDELPFIKVLLSRSAPHSRGITPFFHGFSSNIVKALTPYTSNVVSLRVTLNSQSDLYNGLWPVLCAGMQRLDAIHIELKKMVEGLTWMTGDYEEDEEPYDYLPWDIDGETWMSLTILSRKNLPQLSRLTCPPSMITLFNVPLQHAEIVGDHGPLYVSENDAPRRRLKPYRNSLETLEIAGLILWRAARPAKAAPLHLPSLGSLCIESQDQKVISSILSWLELPQTTRIHLVNTSYSMIPPRFKILANSAVLRSVIATTDRATIDIDDMSILCFVGDTNRLHIENYLITSDTLVDVFAQNASITRLTFKLSLRTWYPLEFNLHAFPHLTNLDLDGSELDTIARMLGPTDKLPKGRAVQQAAPPAPCPALAELVVTFGLAIQDDAAAPTAPKAKPKPKGRAATLRSGSSRATGSESEVDGALRQKCLVLQQVLARRASSGTRLISLVLCIRPAMKGFGRYVGEEPMEPTLWPSPAARRSVLASLQELVDGPVVLKLLDLDDAEVSVEGDEA